MTNDLNNQPGIYSSFYKYNSKYDLKNFEHYQLELNSTNYNFIGNTCINSNLVKNIIDDKVLRPWITSGYYHIKLCYGNIKKETGLQSVFFCQIIIFNYIFRARWKLYSLRGIRQK